MVTFHSDNFDNLATCHQITTEQGLPDNRIRVLFKDSQGYIWVGTGYGVSRINTSQGRSSEFEEITTFQPFQDRNYNLVSSITEDSNGFIWIGSYKGLSRFDGKKITNFWEANQFPAYEIRALHVDSNDHLWIATKESGVYQLNIKLLQQEGKISYLQYNKKDQSHIYFSL